MRNINKFVAIGLGIAMTFTGTQFIEAIFTSRAVQENNISIEAKGNIAIDTGEYAYFTDKENGRFKNLFIPIITTGNVSDVTIDVYLDEAHYNVEPYKHNSEKYNYIMITPTVASFNTKENIQGSITFTIDGESTECKFTITKDNNGNPPHNADHPNHDKCQVAVVVDGHINNIEEPINPEDNVQPEIPEIPEIEQPEVKPEDPEIEQPESPETEAPQEPEIPEINPEDKPVILPL